ncbi:MAG: PPK2 family polyphosphate kinase [Ignavibacteriota bacterium]
MNLKKETTSPPKGIDKKDAEHELKKIKKEVFNLQNMLYAERKHSLLIVLQGMDTAGKDGTISHVFTSVNPMGCNVHSFKTPTAEEASHDFLWRIHRQAPEKGMIEIFNRSHYEDILFPTVHKTIDRRILTTRFEKINQFEENLVDNGTVILKFFLHISKDEQKKRIRERLEEPNKKWKYSANDSKEEKYWDDYMRVYEDIIEKCSPSIPWTVVPADHKWYRNYVVATELLKAMNALNLHYPR